jgi:hypothetical protein
MQRVPARAVASWRYKSSATEVAERPRISGPFASIGRQDLNLRPPGPQPERSRRTRCSSVLRSHLSCAELVSVALSSFPGLNPVAAL